MELNNFVKIIQDIMRNDAGVNGDAQRIEQMTWTLFLKIYDTQEEEWEIYEDNYKSIIPEHLRWRNWAVDKKDGKAKTADDLLNFINQELFPTLKNLEISQDTPMGQKIVKDVFEDNNNYMKDGVLLRQVINIIDELNFDDYNDKHAFGEIYEKILKDLQSAGNAGEFYTPRAVTDFMALMLHPELNEKIADFACGTGGFLTSVLNILDDKVSSTDDRELYKNAVFGIEKKALPYMLCATNMLLHDLDNPNIIHGNSFDRNVMDYTEDEKFNVVIMNPPYGGSEKKTVQDNFPKDLRSSETADLFMSVIMYRLKENGRAAVILPDGFLFGTDNIKVSIKKKLLNEFNLHTVIRLPGSVFAPYTGITTNILFFDKSSEGTKQTWFYRVDMPEGYKHFSKTKPMKLEHFDDCVSWWDDKQSIEIDGFDKARLYTIDEIKDNNYNLDLCGFPHEEEIILPPNELIENYQKERAELEAKIDKTLVEIKKLLDIE